MKKTLQELVTVLKQKWYLTLIAVLLKKCPADYGMAGVKSSDQKNAILIKIVMIDDLIIGIQIAEAIR